MKDQPKKDRFKFRMPIDVRWRDADPMGHVNNAVYFTFFEAGRGGYLRALKLPVSGDRFRDFPFVLVSASCEYLAPATYGERLTLRVRVSRLGTKSFDFEYLLTRGGKSIATGRSVQVAYDYRRKRTIAIPVPLARCIRRYEKL
jgi:acyl-CoA thioester hydrolase